MGLHVWVALYHKQCMPTAHCDARSNNDVNVGCYNFVVPILLFIWLKTGPAHKLLIQFTGNSRLVLM